MNPKNDEALTAATVKASSDPSPTKESDKKKDNTNTRVDIDALIQRAERAMLKRAVRMGCLDQFPDKALCTFDERTQLLILRNARGYLATFRYCAKNNRLTWVGIQSRQGSRLPGYVSTNTAQPFDPLFAETSEECKMLAIFRQIKPDQRHAALTRVGHFLAQDLNGGAP